MRVLHDTVLVMACGMFVFSLRWRASYMCVLKSVRFRHCCWLWERSTLRPLQRAKRRGRVLMPRLVASPATRKTGWSGLLFWINYQTRFKNGTCRTLVGYVHLHNSSLKAWYLGVIDRGLQGDDILFPPQSTDFLV